MKYEDFIQGLAQGNIKRDRLPSHIAILLDGNRRWARQQRVCVGLGYQAAASRLKDIACACLDLKIPILSVWLTSIENWNRDASDLQELFNAIVWAVERYAGSLVSDGVKVCVVGNLDGTPKLPPDLVEALSFIVGATKHNTALVFNLCINYSGRQEILYAVRKLVADIQKPSNSVSIEALQPSESTIPYQHANEVLFRQYLYTGGLQNVDLIIYTGENGRIGLLDFMLWQSTCAELFDSTVNCPDLTLDIFLMALDYYRSFYCRRLAGLGFERLHPKLRYKEEIRG